MKVIIAIIVVIVIGLIVYYNYPHQRINDIQVIGSHNSYKEYIDSPLLALIKKEDTNALALEYSNISLSNQLSLGLRSLEIDIYADAKGGKYAHPAGLQWTGGNAGRPYDPQGIMNEPGFKIFHIQDIDFRSNCLTLKKCLQELKAWSGANPRHEPVYITMNAKDDTIPKPGFTFPEKFTPQVFDELDKVILAQLGENKLIRPDMVRGKFETLEKAVLENNWPKMHDAKGKFVFILDEEGAKRAAYTYNHPSLKGRVLFVNAPEGAPEAAIIIVNDPVKDQDKIRSLVTKGFIVRTRADADTKEARLNDKKRFLEACRSGAQIISTDYYARSSFFKSDYTISFEDGKFTRNNPIVK